MPKVKKKYRTWGVRQLLKGWTKSSSSEGFTHGGIVATVNAFTKEGAVDIVQEYYAHPGPFKAYETRACDEDKFFPQILIGG